MRAVLPSVVLTVAVLVPTVGNTQVYQLPTPAPQVTAANADWQLRREPVFYAGAFYYPTGPTVFFHGSVMVRTGVYQGIPLYADATLEPYSVVYVPIGGNMMRPYERRRDGALAGTVGSRTPSFPGATPMAAGTTGVEMPGGVGAEPMVVPEATRAVGTTGSMVRGMVTPSTPSRPRGNVVMSVPAPRTNNGIWVEFGGSRWYHEGRALSYSPDRFTSIGEYRGFPVYRERGGSADRIYVASVREGPLAPYRKGR